MSFVYPRVISISRQARDTSGGAQPYGGPQASGESVIFSGIPASIQEKSTGARPDAQVSGDASNRTFWRVFIPLSAQILPGDVLRGDIVTDDVGQRYQIEGPYVNSLGPNFLVELLEA